MPILKVRTKKFQERKATIVRAAVEALNAKGIKGTTLADVARQLDLVPTAVMYYFRRKEDLAAACYHNAIALYDSLITEAARGKTAEDSVGIFIRGYFDYRCQVAEGLADPIVTFNDVRALADASVNRAFVQMFRNVRDMLLKSTAISALTRLDINARTHLLLSQLFWVVVWLTRYDADSYGRLAERMTDILVNGIAHTDHSWEPHPLGSILPPQTDKTSAARETFLRAATAVINEQGYLGASVQKISERLNVTKGAFYHHNEAKDDLVMECFARTLDVMRRAQREADRHTSTGWMNLTSVATALIEYQMSGETPLLRTSAMTSVPLQLQTALIVEFNRVSDRFASVFSDGIADGSLRPVDATIGAVLMSAMINASSELQLWAPGITMHNAGRAYARPLFEGLFAD